MADVTIRGAGVFGLTIAWEALQRGARVRVIDPGGPGAGASGGIVGALQPHTPDPWNAKKQFQLDSLLMAEALWSSVEAVSGIATGYGRVGRLMPLMSGREVDLAQERVAAARSHWAGLAEWEVVSAEEAGNWRPPSPTGFLVRDTLSAIVHPRRATESLAGAVTALGGEIVGEGPDEGPVVWANGWQGLLYLGTALGKPVGNGVKGQAALLDHNAAGSPQCYADGLHIVPHLDGTVAIGSTSEREFDVPDATDAQLDGLLERATVLMPILKGARIRSRWAGVRPRAASRAPLLGPWPQRPGHFIANGGFKIGFGMAPKCAKIMADLVLDGRDSIPKDFHTDALC